VSSNKAQLSLTQVTYLGLSISPTHKTITLDHKALLASLPAPTTKALLPQPGWLSQSLGAQLQSDG
jgi:hypothetical protein